MEQDNTYIRFDWAMKHMLRDKANFGILEGLVSVLLGEEVKIDEILESEGNQESERDKFNRVDIKARNSKGHIILVEVQLTRQLYYLERILYGVCKTITEHISIGDKYDQIKKVYSISILYCDYGRGDDYVYHGETRFKGIHTGNDLPGLHEGGGRDRAASPQGGLSGILSGEGQPLQQDTRESARRMDDVSEDWEDKGGYAHPRTAGSKEKAPVSLNDTAGAQRV